VTDPHLCLATAFAAAIDRLGPFEPSPSLAVAVSAGADSMALAVLAQAWALQRNGSVHAFVVDHGLRAESTAEAWTAIARLGVLGIPARLLSLTTLGLGPALAERARIMRYQALTDACRHAGLVHLLLGHHAADQAETVAMRVLRGSRTHGLAGMAALRETATLRLLRPLLSFDPARLRNFLRDRGIDWIEDPSNRDIRALRPRLRHGFAVRAASETGLSHAAAAVGLMRAREEERIAAELATRATIHPEGFALLSPGSVGVGALSSLIRTFGGAAYPPSPSQLAGLARQPGPATLAGVRIMPAGRFGTGWLVVREEAAIADSAEAVSGTVWDNRFHLIARHGVPEGATIGKLGSDAARCRGCSHLPSAILRTLPAIRVGDTLAAVPHIGYAVGKLEACIILRFSPPQPVAGPSFMPAA
jgi:tRNA(Ile)-lysidine synthase